MAAQINLDDGDDASVAACEDRAFLTPPLDQGTIIAGTRVFDLEMASGLTRFFPFDVDTPTSGYNGSYLGPTLEMRTGEDVELNVTNSLGGRETTTHWHGLHVPAAMDGGPHQVILENATWKAEFPIMNFASTYWYHPHPHAMTGAMDPAGTAQQVYEGLAGMLIVRDDASDALALPNTYGTDEFPVIIQDKTFNPDGSLFHLDPTPGAVVLRRGGSFLTNGVVSSEHETPAQVVRLRLHNASNARFYNLGMKDGRTFHQIGSDGGLLPAPVPVARLLIGPAERMEVLVDFGADQDGRVTLRAYNSELGVSIVPDVIADEWDRTDFDIMDFNVTAPTGAPIIIIPASLVPVETIPEAEAHNLGSPRPFELSLNTRINNLEMDINVINEMIDLGDTEVWLVTNVTQMSHPFHVHGDSFQILTRDGAAPPATEAGWKDTVVVAPGEDVRIIKRFFDYADPNSPFMYHCHILDHEDAGMMGQFVVVSGATPTPTATPTPRLTCIPGPRDPAPTPVSADGLKCQRAISKETTKFVKAKTKALQKCHESLIKDKLGPDPGPTPGARLAFCLADAKTSDKIARAMSKIGVKIAKACGGDNKTCGDIGDPDAGEETPDMLGYYGTCPNFESSTVPECSAAITNCTDIANCLECISEAAVDQAITLYYGQLLDVDPVTQKDLHKCQLTIGKETAKFLLAKEKTIAKCWDARLKGKHSDTCPDDTAALGSTAFKAAEKIAKAESKKIVKICKKCGGADKDCDDLVTPVNPLTPMLGGSLGGDDFSPSAIGFPATCDDVKVPNGGPFCDIAVNTLADLIYCVDCVTEFKVDCIDAARIPALIDRVYPCECNP